MQKKNHISLCKLFSFECHQIVIGIQIHGFIVDTYKMFPNLLRFSRLIHIFHTGLDCNKWLTFILRLLLNNIRSAEKSNRISTAR
jgi:hypothetical protein